VEFSLDKFGNLSRIVAQSGRKWLQVKFSGAAVRFSGSVAQPLGSME
jgi:hypothetical protein